jgi:hypothetical protein
MIMETRTSDIPVIQKTKVTAKKEVKDPSSCCTPKNNASVCCTPREPKEESNGACCAQPEDGSACCDK